jgi:hypothetical protein
VETSTKLSLHVSSPSKWVNPMNRRNYDETSSQLRGTTVAITTKLSRNCDESLCQDKNLRRRCCMCDEKPWQMATKIRGNSDENLCQNQTYDVDVVCATKNRGKLRRTFVPIATVVQNKNWLPTNYRRYCDDCFKF